tara:strand:- start:1186 stop:1329 length:144 start_codon:yes stop_codon:yes gene_type:complete
MRDYEEEKIEQTHVEEDDQEIFNEELLQQLKEELHPLAELEKELYKK